MAPKQGPAYIKIFSQTLFVLCLSLTGTGKGFATSPKSPHDMSGKQTLVKKGASVPRGRSGSKGKPVLKENELHTSKGGLGSKQETTPIGAPVNPALQLIMAIVQEAGERTIKP